MDKFVRVDDFEIKKKLKVPTYTGTLYEFVPLLSNKRKLSNAS